LSAGKEENHWKNGKPSIFQCLEKYWNKLPRKKEWWRQIPAWSMTIPIAGKKRKFNTLEES